MSQTPIPPLERPAFFPGQRLAAADLTAARDLEQGMRWLHNRSLHDWGVVVGMAVSPADDGRAARVEAGMAHDCLGRELILESAQDVPVPPVAGAEGGGPRTFHLTASFLSDAEIEPFLRGGECGAGGAVRRPERLRLRWQDPLGDPGSRPRPGIDVVLAAGAVEGCELAGPLSLAERRDAVSVLRPYVAAGATTEGATPWRRWPEGAPTGVATTVSTLAAGFRAAPRYQAHVVGTRLVTDAPPLFVVDGHAHVAEASAGGFELRVVLPEGTGSGAGAVHAITSADLASAIAHSLRVVVAQVPGLAGVDVDELSRYVMERNGVVSLVEGQQLHIDVPGGLGPSIAVPIGREHLLRVLQRVADQFEIALEDLLSVNGIDTPIALALGQSLVGATAPVALNPPGRVLTEQFMACLSGPLGWHVHWVGVER